MAAVALWHHCTQPTISLQYWIWFSVLPCCGKVNFPIFHWCFLWDNDQRPEPQVLWDNVVSPAKVVLRWELHYIAQQFGGPHISSTRGTISSLLNHLSADTGILIHSAQWSLGMPSPKARYPNQMKGSKSMGKIMALIGFWPLLCILGVHWTCCVVMTSDKKPV